MHDAAISDAAALLAASAFPVVAGLQSDLAGIAAAIRLAEKLRGAIDHANAPASLTDAAVLHDAGLMLVSPGEARRRADTLLIVGDGPLAAWPDFLAFLSPQGATRYAEPLAGERVVRLVGDNVPAALAALRARINGRPLAGTPDAEIERIAALLKSAGYGVVLWTPGELDALAVEMLAGLVKDLNAETRWAGLSVAADQSAVAAGMAAGWMIGQPLRTGFGRGFAEHDAWRFDAKRLVESGEADAVVWISTFGDAPPDWLTGVPTVVLTETLWRNSPDSIALPVARPGIDHDAILLDRRSGTLAHVAATAPSEKLSAAVTLNRIAQAIPA